MTHLAPPSVRLLICGNADRGDDGAALSAVATLLPSLPSALLERLEVRRCGHLRVEDLLDVPAGELAVVVDAAVGIPPGHVVTLPIWQIVADPAAPTPRSSHGHPGVGRDDVDLHLGHTSRRGRRAAGRDVHRDRRPPIRVRAPAVEVRAAEHADLPGCDRRRAGPAHARAGGGPGGIGVARPGSRPGPRRRPGPLRQPCPGHHRSGCPATIGPRLRDPSPSGSPVCSRTLCAWPR